jgi:uncharacterized protein YgbK (DUF1537 family)
VTLPLADALALRGPARRTAAVRLALSATVVGCAAAALALAAGTPQAAEATAAVAGPSVELVIDLSGSVADISNPQILRVLQQTAASNAQVGLVVFSDTAEEVLPPGTPARELRKLFRFFEPVQGHEYGPTPWSLRFTGGTSISTGVAAAREALRRDRSRGTVVLVSDAADAAMDEQALRRQLLALAREPLDFRLVLLRGSSPADAGIYRRIFGRHAVRMAPPAEPAAATARHGGGFPVWATAIAAIAALLLAARELLAISLRWRAA